MKSMKGVTSTRNVDELDINFNPPTLRFLSPLQLLMLRKPGLAGAA
jgi:hypothetical protein